MSDETEKPIYQVMMEYDSLQQRIDLLDKAIIEFSNQRDALLEQMNTFDNRKQQFVVRIYKKIYYDRTVPAFTEDQAIRQALAEEIKNPFILTCYKHMASADPEARVLCLSNEYTDERKANDDPPV